MQLREQRFQSTSAVHLLPDDGCDPLQDPPHQRQIRIDAGSDTPDVARPKKQLVRCDLRFGGNIPERHQHQAGDAHDRSLKSAKSYHRSEQVPIT